MRKNKKRFISGLLAAAMTLNLISTTVLAGGEGAFARCEHHREHTADCGYAPASQGRPCGHTHTEACYETVTRCVHEHTDACYPEEPEEEPEVPSEGGAPGLLPEGEDTPGRQETEPSDSKNSKKPEEKALSPEGIPSGAKETAGGEKAMEPEETLLAASACAHTCTEASGCVTRTLTCPHIHDGACGYEPASQGSPCTFECALCGGAFAEPEWVEDAGKDTGAPDLADGEQTARIYAAPLAGLSAGELSRMQEQSAEAKAELNPNLQIPPAGEDFGKYITGLGFAYINGNSYTGGDITVTEGDNFSYNFTWSPNPDKLDFSSKYWAGGAWFQIKLFTIPNLNLPQNAQGVLSIGGVRVADWTLEYDRTRGEMWYRVVFNEFITFFEPGSVLAQFQGSGKFQGEANDVPITFWEKEGTLTIEPRPEIPPTPGEPAGTGWAPVQPPSFDNDPVPFGKGIKWTSGTDPTREAEIDWRIVFFDLLQQAQEDYLEEKEPETFKDDTYLIIEDTLDENQRFYVPTHESDEKRFGGAPFHLELPVLAAGTDTILNGSIGKGEYDGPGEIASYISGSVFREIKVEGDMNDEKARETVKETPLTWAIVHKPDPNEPNVRRETLIINAGVPGGKSNEKSLTWEKATRGGWYLEGLEKRIAECEKRIADVQNGVDSPISLLDTRQNALRNRLQRAANQPQNSENMEVMKKAIDEWEENYRAWREDERVHPLAQLVDSRVDPPVLFVPLPEIDRVKDMAKWTVDASGTPLENTLEYQNYILSLENLVEDQDTYLANRSSYGRGWTQVKERYEKTLDFYETYGVYGFTVKVRSHSINTSMKTYENRVKISLENREWNAQDSGSITFGAGIVGDFALGSVVLQKADAHYIPEDLKSPEEQAKKQEEVMGAIGEIKKNGGALEGVTFEMYGVISDQEFDPDTDAIEENLAHFLPPEASENGAYRFTHVGSHNTGSPIRGEVEELEVDGKGQLSVSHLFNEKAMDFYLLEKETPKGFYRDPEPIPVTSQFDKVLYHLIPNVSRSVRLTKVDSYSNKGLAGAEFQLVQTHTYDEEKEEYEKLDTPKPITGFEKREKEGSGEVGYWSSDGGKDPLLTNDNGVLCLHGLDPGKYCLQETAPPEGYTIPKEEQDIDGKGKKYEFTVGYDLPDRSQGEQNESDKTWKIDGQIYNEDYHILLPSNTEDVKNDPNTADLKLTKVDGTNPDEKLEGAGFALFRFEGTEAQWEAGEHDDPNNWGMIGLFDEEEPENPDVPADAKDYFQLPKGTEKKEFTIKDSSGNPLYTGQAALTKADGTLEIKNIPVGHYSIAEVLAPKKDNTEYQRPFTSMYFQVTGTEGDKEIQLYDNPSNHANTNAIAGNQVKNYTKLAQLALVKYDAAGKTPTLEDGEAYDGGWKYNSDFADKLKGDYKPLPEATYKLFMSMGGNSEPNPDPEETNLSNEFLTTQKPQHDPCLAMGTTDEEGILRLSEMTPNKRYEGVENGLNMEYYYLVEVKAPEGYLLDQNPIRFPLVEDTIPAGGDTPGLIKTAANKKTDYGLQLTKVDGEMPETEQNPEKWGLAGAVFEVRKGENTEPLSFVGDNGVYRLSDDPTAVSSVVTGEGGALTVTGLEGETAYTFTEIKAPQGYHRCGDGKKEDAPCPGGKECDPLEITLTTAKDKRDGTLTDGVLYPDEPKVVRNARLLGRMELYKKDEETGEALAGASFQLYETIVEVIPEGDPDYDPQNPGATRSWDETVGDPKETDENGRLIFEDLEWSDFYYVQEVEAPEGYALDQTKLMFSIDRYSFETDGTPATVLFPYVSNSKSAMGRAKLVKVDAEDEEKRLEDAHFYLMKKMKSATRKDQETWVGYGQGMYITDEKGELHFLLPPGDYKLLEMKAPDGYVIIGMDEIHFTIPEDPQEDEVVLIDDNEGEDDKDGVVKNKKGTTGVHLTKLLNNQESLPVPGVTFRIYTEELDIDPDGSLISKKDYLHFLHRGGGNYEYVKKPGDDATQELVTNENGEIFVMLDQSFVASTKSLPLNYEEIAAPEGIAVPKAPENAGSIGSLYEGIYKDITVSDNLKDLFGLKIFLNKSDGKSKKGLEGAKFSIYQYSGTEAHEEDKHTWIGTGTTDASGHLTFQSKEDDFFPLLMPGGTYHIVEEEAPAGYVRDETHHEVVLDKDCFDPQFQFHAPTLNLYNYQTKGAVKLRKVDEKNPKQGLEGAEFELLRKDESADPLEPHWEHYGKWRYVTDKEGELVIGDLPYGSYELIERTAPLGYVLGDPPVNLTFQITEADHGKTLDLGAVENPRDPNPAKAVRVRKVDAENPSKGLPGAHFQLYYLGEDGEYHLRSDQVYITDEKGELFFPTVPAGSYALKEVKAPEGYLLPEHTMTKFTVPSEGDAPEEVTVQIENRRQSSGGGPEPGPDPEEPDPGPDPEEPDPGPDPEEPGPDPEEPDPEKPDPEEPGPDPEEPDPEKPDPDDPDNPGGTEELTVHKVWRGTDQSARPETVSVQLYRGGEPHGDPVELSEENDWTYTWDALDPDETWMVDEVEVPEGYYKAVRKQGEVWTIYNSTTPATPEDPDNPGEPQKPEDPKDPQDPQKPQKPNLSGTGTGVSKGGGSSGTSSQAENAGGGVPKTGDPSRPLLWLGLLGASGAAIGFLRRRRRQSS